MTNSQNSRKSESENGENNVVSIYNDVTSHSIKLKTASGFSTLIPRFTRLPKTHKLTFQTSKDGETFVYFPIYEGEGNTNEELHRIDAFRVEGFPPLPRGQVKFEVECIVDLNGTLSVCSRVIEPPDLDLENKITVSAMTERQMNKNMEIWKEKSDLLDKRDEEFNLKKKLKSEFASIERELKKIGKV